jgi:tetratricopeptide (TPR) repeat protein
MAKSTLAPSLSLDDDGESLMAWFQANGKLIGLVAGGAVVVAAGVLFWRSSENTKKERASAALGSAQAAFAQGEWAKAAPELEKVATRYAGTMAGAQAAMLQAQALFEQANFKAGMAALEAGLKAAPAESRGSFHGLMASGAEGLGDWAGAAGHYAQAAALAASPAEKGLLQAAQARALTRAGKPGEALTLWKSLAADESSPVTQEARVRIGELVASGAK